MTHIQRTFASRIILALGVAAAVLNEGVSHAAPAGEEDLFQQAVNYVFTGRIDPKTPPKIVDRKACVVERRDPKFNRYIRYYLRRIKMSDALYDKRYSGRRVFYQLNVKGDDVVIEYLDADRKTVTTAYRSAQIALPGDIDSTRKALAIIFRDYCKPEPRRVPF